MRKTLHKLTRLDWLIMAVILVLGLSLRLYPGKDHFIWTYDQARDVFRSQNILAKGDLKLVGPQTEFTGLSHGPLHYYLWTPFLNLAQGDPNLTVYWQIIWNLSTLLPLALLTQALFRDKKITVLAALIFVMAYQQVEYSRWLSNVATTMSFLAWTYYFLWQTLAKKKFSYFLGLALGLAIQGEIFLVYLVPVIYLFFWSGKLPGRAWLKLHLGLMTGGVTFILAELKYGLLGLRTFVTEFLAGHSSSPVMPRESVNLYLNHWGLTVQQNLVGLTSAMGLWFLLIGIGCYLWRSSQKTSALRVKFWPQTKFLLLLILSHSILFVFHAIDAVFLDISILIPLYVLVSALLIELFRRSRLWFGLILGLMVASQVNQLVSNTKNYTPFASYNFIQDGITYSQKLEIADAMYQLAGSDQPFSLSVLGTPYGVRTVWASVLEQYSWRTNRPLPLWHGFAAAGYEGEGILTKTDHPLANHILLIESNQELLDKYVRDLHLAHQDSVSQVVTEKELYGYRIQLRKPTIPAQE